MDKISLIDMQFWGYHGVLKEEQVLGQRFHLDVTIELNLTKAGISDALEDSVSYADIYSAVERIVTGEPCQLLEALCYKTICEVAHLDPRIQTIEVVVRKPQAPIPGHFAHSSVTMKRQRQEVCSGSLV